MINNIIENEEYKELVEKQIKENINFYWKWIKNFR